MTPRFRKFALVVAASAATLTACTPAHAAATYADLHWSTSPKVQDWNGRTFRSVIPANPVGIVWVFHGTNGSSDFVDSPEMQFVLQVMLDRGYGFVAAESRGTKWDSVHGASSNVDWPYVDGLRRKLIADGRFTSKTPTFALGFSAGGTFASWVGNVAPDKGWPLKALVLHNASGWNQTFRADLPNLPIAFVPSKNDDVFPLTDVRTQYDSHRSRGYADRWLLTREQGLVPTRFDRSTYLDRADSLRLFDAFVAHGWYDGTGRRKWTGDVNSFLDRVLPGARDVTPIKPTKAVMASVLATHAIASVHADDEADFLDAHR